MIGTFSRVAIWVSADDVGAQLGDGNVLDGLE